MTDGNNDFNSIYRKKLYKFADDLCDYNSNAFTDDFETWIYEDDTEYSLLNYEYITSKNLEYLGVELTYKLKPSANDTRLVVLTTNNSVFLEFRPLGHVNFIDALGIDAHFRKIYTQSLNSILKEEFKRWLKKF